MHAAQEKEWIVIRGWGSLSGLGSTPAEIKASYATGKTTFTTLPHLGLDIPVSPLSASGEAALQALVQEEPVYFSLDRSVLMAIVAARQAVAQAGWASSPDVPIGVNIGSSRGATGLFEQYHEEFLQNPEQRLSPSASPSTTLGNVASWVANDLNASGPVLSHSVTCSTALQAFANGVAWLRAGMAKRFLVGGTEAPLTPFTLAQMKAIGIYTKFAAHENPCRPLNPGGHNTFTLGEGAAVFALERMAEQEMKALPQDQFFTVAAVGMGFERSPSKTGISQDGQHFQKALRNALDQANLVPSQIDSIVVHAPGTRAGDPAELAAIHSVFGSELPTLYSNKLQIGHTLGASGGLSAAYFLDYLSHYPNSTSLVKNNFALDLLHLNNTIISSAGFGGNASALLLQKFTI
ncbi:beta-ketoacyl synthase N-terminal-like domain-containing protein [Rufibacter soli]